MLSYGLALLAVLAVAILLVARSFRPLPWVLVAAVVVVLGFAAAGYAWWEAFPVLRERYWDGIAGRRPATYWLWGNLAALCFSAGPLAAAGTAVGLARFRERRPLRAPPELGASSSARGNAVPNGQRNARGITSPYSSEQTVAVLACAAVLTIVIADLSRMSKAEVERIWLPFVPWLLLGCALLPPRWQRASLALQVAFALAVQHLLFTAW